MLFSQLSEMLFLGLDAFIDEETRSERVSDLLKVPQRRKAMFPYLPNLAGCVIPKLKSILSSLDSLGLLFTGRLDGCSIIYFLVSHTVSIRSPRAHRCVLPT